MNHPLDPNALAPQSLSQVSVEQVFKDGLRAYHAGDLSRAVEAFSQVLVQLPGFPPALTNRALAAWSLGDLDHAAADAQAACHATPDLAEAWLVAGAILIDRGDPPGAISHYQRAVALRPELAAARAGLAAACLAAGQHAGAEQAAALALALDPNCLHARFTLGSARSAQGDPLGAIHQFDHVLAADTAHAGAYLNRGNARINRNDIEGGIADLRAALAVNPGLKEAWASLGVALTIEGDTAGAITACDHAIALDPDFAVAHWNRGVAALLAGDFATGFAAYEWRKRHPVYGSHFDRLPAPTWQGEPLAGRHLLVRAEQGLGDTIMFARFLPALASQARHLTLACHKTLHTLFAGMGIGLCTLDDPAPPDVDCAIDQMSLPHVLALTPATIPAAQGYLAPTPANAGHWNIDRWRAALAHQRQPGQRLIGLVWAGNPGHNNDQRRSLPPGALTPVLAVPNTSFIALQLGARQAEYDIPSLAPQISDFASTAGILANLDAIVTVDTSIAHLAGAMGKPCHVLLSASCDWRWLLGRTTTPWYDHVHLHRQSRLGDWSGPIQSVLAALASSP
ncbi:tetratricopeptide repeat protein [Acidiphilium sp. PA]|uniref:tetratricopeptide repeat-containing glycosyltransferase family protein n=1 Tax=Acidiphilium sp. PA TaxID=2871705 RepID=UPI002243479A|nr:tetratricopeptide repeat protein [Acidiphilium sp. PA]MCW8308260.1 tetratricopeptide repeat protein [Acidiphilium sp. PA]